MAELFPAVQYQNVSAKELKVLTIFTYTINQNQIKTWSDTYLRVHMRPIVFYSEI